MDRILRHNQSAWDRQSAAGSPWCEPVSVAEIEAARRGDVSVILTPVRPVPTSWLGDLRGARVLCLASGGGQQAPLHAAVAVASQSPARTDYAVTGNPRLDAPAHDVSYCPEGARSSRQRGDISIGRHPSGRDAPHDRQHPPCESGRLPTASTHVGSQCPGVFRQISWMASASRSFVAYAIWPACSA